MHWHGEMSRVRFGRSERGVLAEREGEREREIRDGRETRDNGMEQEREGRATERENHREW